MLGLTDRIHQYEPIFDAWYIKEEIGSGSFGRVYKAERVDEFGNTFVCALKAVEVLPKDGTIGTPEQLARRMQKLYQDEVLPMSALCGADHIVCIFDHAVKPIQGSETILGYDILIRMELLDPLEDLMRDGKLQELHRDSVRIGMEMCHALMSCAKINYLHRDIKPKNMFRNRFGEYKLGDFGIAKQLEGTQLAKTAIGAPLYAAPEVSHEKKYDARADLYSLGLVLYQINNEGRLPFFHENMPESEHEQANIRRLTGDPFDPPSQAPQELADIIMKACSYEPDDRYASAEEMYQALQEYSQPKKIVEIKPEQRFWFEEQPEYLDIWGIPIRIDGAMLQLAQQMLPKEQEEAPQEEQLPVQLHVLQIPEAQKMPAWRPRSNWLPCNRLELNGYSGIASRAFFGRADLLSVKCGQDIVSIDERVFAQCSNLTQFTAENGLKDIGEAAFLNCMKLESCALPDSVAHLGGQIFSGCSALQTFEVPKQVEQLEEHVFRDCKALKKIELPESLCAVGRGCFRGSGLTSIQFPDQCVQLGEHTFAGCRSLAKVQLAPYVMVIPKSCFSGCTALETIVLPSHLDTIEECAFHGCSKLERLILPDSVTWIGTHAFEHCDNLTQIYLPPSVAQIGEEIFGAGGFWREKFGKLTVFTQKNSYAWEYCKSSGIRVKEGKPT